MGCRGDPSSKVGGKYPRKRRWEERMDEIIDVKTE
jgi:hypothetical protein